MLGRPSFRLSGSVAQLVERSTENRKVTGSTPVGATAFSACFSRFQRAPQPFGTRRVLVGTCKEFLHVPKTCKKFGDFFTRQESRVQNFSMWKPDLPYNELPFPPVDELETRSILRAAANARAALAGLDQAGQTDSQPRDSHLPSLLEAQASSEIENIVTTTDDLFRDENLKERRPGPSGKGDLRYREALFAGLKEVRRRPLNTNIALEASSHISGYNMELRSLPGTFIGNSTTLERRYTPPRAKISSPASSGIGRRSFTSETSSTHWPRWRSPTASLRQSALSRTATGAQEGSSTSSCSSKGGF